MFDFLAKIIGTKNEREIKKLWLIAEQINSLEPSLSSLSDAELKARTDEFRRKINEERAWTVFSRRHLPRSGKLRAESSRCGILTFS